MKYSATLAMIIAMLVAASAATAAKKSKFYKWTDENGVVHYTQEPPPDQVSANEVTVQDLGPASSSPSAVETEQGAEGADTTELDDVSAQLAAEAKRYEEQAELMRERQKQVRNFNCQKGRTLKAALEPSQRTIIRDDQGNERVVSGDDRIQELQKAQNLIDENCGA